MSSLKIPDNIPEDKAEIAAEIHRLHESTLWSSQGQFELSKQWRLMNIILGVPAAVLAAIAGVTGLAQDDKSVFSAVLALLAAGFGATLTTLNPSRRVSLAQTSGNAYMEIQTATRQFLLIDLKGLAQNDARKRLDKLSAKRDEINRTAEPPNYLARLRAKKNIEKGGQSYDIDS